MDKFKGEAILWLLHGSENGISPDCDGTRLLLNADLRAAFESKRLLFSFKNMANSFREVDTNFLSVRLKHRKLSNRDRKPELSQLTESNFLEVEALDSEGRNNLSVCLTYQMNKRHEEHKHEHTKRSNPDDVRFVLENVAVVFSLSVSAGFMPLHRPKYQSTHKH